MKTKGSKNKKGVLRIISHGYVHIFKPEHPEAMKNGYVREHRMIAYDAGLLRNPNDEVHHINGIKADNRLENLEIMSKEKHTALTHRGRKVSEKYPKCKFCEVRTKSKYQLCAKHYKLEWQRGNIYENPELLK